MEEFGHFWMGMDSLEQLVIGNGEILLVNTKNGESTKIGNTLAEARSKLAELSKDENFPDFMNDYSF
ncbi:MAG: hypothetical protein K0R55_2574 [Sporomusa sp.]|nr:hypothetical protein [Sporomusa sp.]